MSLKASPVTRIPKDTARVAKAAFPKGNRYLTLRDTFGELFTSEDFRDLYHAEGRPAIDPARLALVTLVQFAENLSDKDVTDAVRSRIDLKYLLALPLEDPGFDASVLCEFRARLLDHQAEMILFDTLLERFRGHKLLRARGRQRTDSTHVLAAVQALNRLACAQQTLRHALNALATVAPAWLLEHAPPAWAERYARGVNAFGTRRLNHADQDAFISALAADGLALLTAVSSPQAPAWLREVPAIKTLWRVWLQNFTWTDGETLRLRTNDEIPPARAFIGSPFDHDARLGRKTTTQWVGYKAHLTETCEEDLPLLVTNVATTPATTQDFDVLHDVHDALSGRGALPREHLVDLGYLSANLLVSEQRDHGVELIGPARHDQHRQAWEGQGFAAEDFAVDWDAQMVTCPAGNASASWTEASDARGRPVIKIKFAIGDCRACLHKAACTTAPRRTVTLQVRAHHEAMMVWRARERTPEFKALYARRAGIEGTVSVAVRSLGLRRSRYLGLEKTHLQHVVTASALNLVRVADWLEEKPRARTRLTAFERVLQVAA